MDALVDEHFRFEALDDVDGVMSTLRHGAVHEVIPWHGRIVDGAPFLCDGRSGKVSFRLLHVFEIRDGKISREQVWCDLAAIQRQLGCAPS
jgi:ketosteroid isomerase-like protein